MWYDNLQPGDTWASLWHGYVLCGGGGCLGIRRIEASCPACGAGPMDTSPITHTINGRQMTLAATFMGAEGRYEDYVYLQMLQREWQRPIVEFEGFSHFPDDDRPSSRAAFVLLFWGYFETRIERLLRTAMRTLPERLLEDTLRRYSGVGSRVYDLYKIFFDTNYFDDVHAQGYPTIAKLLKDVHKRRNEFAHGRPQAINDATVTALAQHLKSEHEAWIAVYNNRISQIT